MSTLTKFTVVSVNGVDDNKPSVEPWSPQTYENPENQSSPLILGVTMTDSEFQEPVAVMRRGYMRGVTPSESWSVGDLLWANGGDVTNVRPDAPLPQVFVGTVFDSDGGSAPYTVEVNVTVLPNIGELSGVDRQVPEDLDVLIFKDITKVWEPRPLDYGERSTLMHPFLFMGGS